MSLIQKQVRDQTDFIDNREEKEWIKSLYIIKNFLFTYNSIIES